MINLTYTPQRADFKADYVIDGDILIVTIAELQETFDFTDLEDGMTEENAIKILPVNPIVNVEKTGSVVNITVIRYYGEDEKELFEEVN